MNVMDHLIWGGFVFVLFWLFIRQTITLFLPWWVLLIALIYGTTMPDMDAAVSFKFHRSIFTHGTPVILIFSLIAEYSSYNAQMVSVALASEQFAVFLFTGIALHIFQDLIPARGPIGKRISKLIGLQDVPVAIRGLTKKETKPFMILSLMFALLMTLYFANAQFLTSLRPIIFAVLIGFMCTHVILTLRMVRIHRISAELAHMRSLSDSDVRLLEKKGITRIKDLARSDPSTIAEIIGKSEQIAGSIINRAKMILIVKDFGILSFYDTVIFVNRCNIRSIGDILILDPKDAFEKCDQTINYGLLRATINIAKIYHDARMGFASTSSDEEERESSEVKPE